MKHDLSWGHSIAVRTAFLETISGGATTFGYKELEVMNYPPHEGDEELIQLTKEVIYRQTGQKYEHILLTNGATGGVTIALRAYQQQGYEVCHVEEPPFFPLYPSMTYTAGFKSYSYGSLKDNLHKTVRLIDSPSNPLGTIKTGIFRHNFDTKVIWDAVYHNNVYTSLKIIPIDHDVVVGSYSKLTGLNGIRIGWIATNDRMLYERLRKLVTAEYAGLDVPSVKILLKYLKDFYWDSFETNATYKLNCNREQWSKLEKYFGDQPVSPCGMFYYGPMDKACKKLLEKSGITWMPGSSCGTNDDFGRFNLGQDNKIIMNAVKQVLKNDKR
jgi:aspartate/methionine/tyrosine aminotransferase